MLKTETIYPGGNLPKQKYLKRMWRGLAVLLLSILIILVIRSCNDRTRTISASVWL